MYDLISRAEAVEKAKECFDMGDCYCDKPAIIGMLNSLTQAQPELIEKAAYIRGFEQGRTQGMIDTKAEEVAQTNLQPTCNQLATDVISRKAALDGIADYLEEYDGIDENGNHDLKWCAMKEAELLIKDLPSAQPEITDEQAIAHLQASGWMQSHDKQMYEMGLKERLADDSDSYDALLPPAQPEQSIAEWQKDFREYINMLNIPRDDYNGIMEYINDVPSVQPEINCSEIPNTSDLVSRKAVREMVATWSYDMAEWEDVELALHDVDELPPAQLEVIHCKDCKHYRTTGAFGVPLHKEEYFCDADNYPKNDSGEEQRELPEWWFCAGAERKYNKYILDCQTCDLENPSGFKMRDRFTTVPKDVYEKMQMVDLREEQEERIVASPIMHPLKGE